MSTSTTISVSGRGGFSFTEWFNADVDDGSLDPATDAFEEAICIYRDHLTKDQDKRQFISRSHGFAELQATLAEAQQKYESLRVKSKTREYLTKFSNLLCHYDNVMKCLIQHNPEYVSLAWGAMKFLFVAFVNHENACSTLAKGLCQIGSILPRAELSLILYPTKRMKRAVAELYANIIKFLVRSKRWYEEGKLKHIWHSLSRPSELRYADLLENVKERSELIETLSASGSQAEQREIHRKIDNEGSQLTVMHEEVRELKAIILRLESKAINSFIDTNCRLNDLQFAQICQSLRQAAEYHLLPEPETTYRRNIALQRATERAGRGALLCTFDWASSKLTAFSSASKLRSLALIRGGYHSRDQTRGLIISTLTLLRSSNIPVIWALKIPHYESKQVPVTSVMKYLILQVMQLPGTVLTELDAANACARFYRAVTAEDYWLILASLLASVANLYIVIDVDIAEEFPWVEAASRMFGQLDQRGAKTRLRVILVTNRPVVSAEDRRDHLVIKAPSNNAVTGPRSGTQSRRGAGMNGIRSRASGRRALRLT
ncbi:hypothetical protein QC761_703500 [Podospora bellae-mahoneyi]|uniref:DUF7708 domain-containing protein n=1 Tax=Podospora bellae-mahoneyi TaxID=2093777 RepID=A0ABR0F898_9PEZI|nr:hypothetical protein QC761_703500 [Podospora bellae-mahoneyi]